MDSKEKILLAALTLFTKEGFHGTSTSKIASEAGISNGTLFHHFKTKEELVSKLYIKIKENYRDYLLANTTDCKTMKQKLKQLWINCVNWNLNNLDSVKFFNMFSNSPYIDCLSKQEGSRNFTFMRDLFKEAIENDVIMDMPVDLVMDSFLSSVKVYFNYSLNHSTDSKDFLDFVFAMWWKSVVNI